MAFKAHRFAPILFILLFSSSADLVSAQPDCTVTLNSGLVAGSDNNPPWTSGSGEFAFGFRPLQRSSATNNQDLFLLSIWFNKIPEQTIVWSLNNHLVPRDSRIQLTSDGQLILYDRNSVQLWRAVDNNARSSSCASMLDSGNFVLIGDDAPRSYTWQSFDSPTDTILPGQQLTEDKNVTSRQTETSYSDGRFQLRMQRDGNLVLYSIFLPTEWVNSAYWSTNTVDPSSDTQLVFHESGYVYLQRNGRNIRNVTEGDVGSSRDYYQLVRVDFDGVLRYYKRPKRVYAADASSCTSAWSVVQTTPRDICSALIDSLGSGACGYNSYCVSSSGGPRCACPEGYSLLDPLDPFGGCKPDFSLPSCQSNSWESNFELVEFKEIENTDWPLTDYELQTSGQVDKETCKNFCLRDCFCAAAIYNGNNCWKKKFPLSNGRQSMQVNRTALIKVPRNNATTGGSCPKSKDRTTLVLVGSLLLGSSVFVNVLLFSAIAFAVFFLYSKNLLSLDSASSVPGMRRYTYKELEDSTGNFKQQLGKGSFGTVYKGVTPNLPKRFVAVKRLDNFERDGEREFITEVRAIARTHHKNLVALLGYCDEKNHRLLVYEYMSSGSLSSLLFGIQRPHWNKRMQIAYGIARGLTYLHEECPTQIIHCDVKPQNILLDEWLTPKISDFGLAKLLLTDQSRAARTHIRGTVGYFAPEWFKRASVSAKVDVYSFGVMLVEMICCTSSVEFSMKEEQEADGLVDWAYECYSGRDLGKLVENDEEARNDMASVERFVKVAMWCVQEDPSLRPTMRRVAQMLEGVTDVSIPPRPFGV